LVGWPSPQVDLWCHHRRVWSVHHYCSGKSPARIRRRTHHGWRWRRRKQGSTRS